MIPFSFKGFAVAAGVVLAFGLQMGRTFPVMLDGDSPFQNSLAGSQIRHGSGAWGAAWADVDNDGWLDLAVFAGLGNFALLRNLGDGTFADVTEGSGIIPPLAYNLGGAFADFNNDGCSDLYLAVGDEEDSLSLDVLYRGNCDGTFTDVSLPAGIGNPGYGVGVAWADYDNDGFLDTYVTNRGKFRDGALTREHNVLWRNSGDGTFANVAQALGVGGFAPSCFTEGAFWTQRKPDGAESMRKIAMQPVWFDYDSDGDQDLFVATEELPSPLYENLGDGSFAEATERVKLCASTSYMGVAPGDYDNDGDLDLYVTDDGPNALFMNGGAGAFVPVARALGVDDELALGWGTGFFDYNNDGFLDLYIANGRVAERDEVIKFDKVYKNERGEGFRQVSSKGELRENIATRAAAFGDYNRDGFTDVFVSSSPFLPGSHHRLFEYEGNGNNWLTVKLVGTVSNASAIGARIILDRGGLIQTREVRSGSSYASQDSLWQTFGLGSFKRADSIEVRWPSGARTLLYGVGANQEIVITEGKEGFRAEKPPGNGG
ncbi:MAG: CRTAC1 family protein [bacterium]|nr:CRTAC1 family protein [bacterium]